MISADWKTEYQNEIEHARLARQTGNEGMARVCARRAAAVLIGEYLSRRGISSPDLNAYERLQEFTSLADVDSTYKTIARHFLLRVDSLHNLPPEIDLIKEATLLKKGLLGIEKT